jgi:D-aminoacyl-tRNA deacylase
LQPNVIAEQLPSSDKKKAIAPYFSALWRHYTFQKLRHHLRRSHFFKTFIPQSKIITKAPTMILLAYSRIDNAGANVAKQLLTTCQFRKTDQTYQEASVNTAEINGNQVNLITLKDETIYAQDLPDHFPKTELLIFLSRHKSQSGKPTLSVHAPGNFGNAELGGLPRTLSVCPATAMYNALKTLYKLKTQTCLNYDVSYECTHHGPSLNVPTMFLELGSSPQQWSDLEAAGIVANAAIEAVRKYSATPKTAIMGIGGPHYNPRFTKMALDEEVVFGHIIPKYALPLVDREIIQQCVDKTMEKVTHALLDWKGIPSQSKPRLLDFLEQINLQYAKA